MSRERFDVSYKFNPKGATQEKQINPRLVVMDQYYPEHNDSLKDREMRTLRSRTDINAELARKPLFLSVSVPDSLNPGAENDTLQVNLKIKSMNDFTPAGIAEQIKQSEGDENRELRTALIMLEAAQHLQARLKASNKANLQFVQELVMAAAKKMEQPESPAAREMRQNLSNQISGALSGIKIGKVKEEK